MMRVKIAELKDHLSEHLRAVERGDEVEVMDRNRLIARIVPIPAGPHRIKIIAPKRPFSEIRDRHYPTAGWPADSLELLLEERGPR